MNWLKEPGNILSLIAVVVSVVACITSWRTQKRLVVVEESRERDRLKHARKAKLRAELVHELHGRSSGEKLRIYNDGDSEAREMVLILDGKPIREHPAVVDIESEVNRVSPHSHVQYLVALTRGTYPPWDLQVAWVDDSGESGTYRTTITA